VKKSLRVVMARLGLDAHWRGSIVVARALRDAGMEVIYIGNQMPEGIVGAAIQEDADVIGLSTLSGNHMILAPQVMSLLKERGMEKTPVVLGGTIPPDDIPRLRETGVARVFGPGSSLKEIIQFISGIVET